MALQTGHFTGILYYIDFNCIVLGIWPMLCWVLGVFGGYFIMILFPWLSGAGDYIDLRYTDFPVCPIQCSM